MNPNEISDTPRKDSMGMDMVPFEPEAEQAETPKGLAAITITDKKQDLIGLAFSPVKKMRLFKETRTSARIVPDETRLFRITVKLDGWVEKLFVNQTGQYVKKGDRLFKIYSPDLVSAQQEYLSSIKALKKSDSFSDSADSAGFRGLESASRKKLKLLDIDDEQIDRLRASGEAERTMTIESRFPGM